MKKNINIILSISAGLIILFYFIRNYSLTQFRVLLPTINFPLFFLGMILMNVNFTLMAKRWKLLYPEYSFKDSYYSSVIAIAANTVIPWRGGEIVRSLFLKRRTGISNAQNLGKIAIERIFDVFLLFVLLLFASVYLGSEIRSSMNHILMIGIGLFLAVFLAGIVYKKVNFSMKSYLVNKCESRFILSKIVNKIFESLDILNKLTIKNYIIGIITTFLITLISVVVFWIMSKSSQIDVSLFETFIIYPIVTLSISLPISVGYVGVFHAASILALSFLGIQDPDLIGKVIILHLFRITPPLLLGWVLMVSSNHFHKNID